MTRYTFRVTIDPQNILKQFYNATYEGGRVVLVPYSEERDLILIHEMFSDERTTGPLGVDGSKFTIEKLKEQKIERMEGSDSADWTIFLKDDGETFIGEIGLVNWDYETHVVEVFTAVSPDFTGKGYGAEAMSLLMERIFARSMISVVRIQTLSSNVGALKMCGKLGFRETGRRAVQYDPEIGFKGGIAVVMDCRVHEFRKVGA